MEGSKLVLTLCVLCCSDEQLKKSDQVVDTTRDQLKHAPWFQAGIARELALEKLSQEGIGAFIVRSSTTHPGCFALSVKVPKFDNPTGISHYLITRTPSAGFKVKGLEKEWQTLTALVTHHTVMQEMLPCTLRLPRNSRNPSFRDSDRDEEEEDYRKVCSSTGKNLPDLQA
ncbi:hypothetical protein NP493_720g01033 [Ridgeia piscesae]|uniref:SH2 domain-containing protein n=1 Tax=Ridgeia piscesae TaxID=27915 RepID=A0AAD9NMN1_RIDPI|nr:hypothetical protein NP493_720g01033 [Ridgeia piscesae]